MIFDAFLFQEGIHRLLQAAQVAMAQIFQDLSLVRNK